MLPYGRQSISEDDIDSVCEVLRSNFLTCGPKVGEFERAFAAKVGAAHAVSCNSATSALHIALRVAGIGPGDRVVTTPNTFLASANCAAYVGAIPDFSDIDPHTYNLDPVALEKNWLPDTKAVVAVAYAGQPCDMPAIARIARERGAIVIEDACHGVGGGFENEGRSWKLGGHPWADMTTFSFHPVKTMTTGEGGILVTDKPEWAAQARRLCSHGIVRDPADFVGLCSSDEFQLLEKGPWYYEMQELGYNYRLTDLQCALGLSQLKRLDVFIARRQEILAHYNEAFANLPWLQTPALAFRRSTLDFHASSFILHPSQVSWHLYTMQLDFPALAKTRTQVMAELRSKGIGTQVLYIPVYLQPWYRKTYGYAPGKCPMAEAYYLQALSLPLFPEMSDADVEHVISAVLTLQGS